MTDPIADLLTRIRNAARARQDVVMIPCSGIKEEIVKILKEEGFVSNYIKEEVKPQAKLKVFLKYNLDHKPVIHRIARVSRPGGRCYKGYRDLKAKGMVISILSTPKGILTDKRAFKEKVGGEVLCEVW